MSESFPFGSPTGGPSSPSAPPSPAAPDPAADSDGTDARRRLILVLGLAVVALVALAAAYLLFLGGDEEGAEVTVPATYGPRTSAATPSATSTPKAAGTAPATFDDVAGRDPFRPLVVPMTNPPSPAPSGTPTSGGTGSTTATTPGAAVSNATSGSTTTGVPR